MPGGPAAAPPRRRGAALSGSAPAVAVVSGEQRLLVIRATWGPKPYTTEQVQDNVRGVDAFYQASSFGRVSFTGTVTPWLKAYASPPPQCNLLTVAYDADAAARAAGYDLSAYDETAYLFPADLDCPWTGARWGNRIFLNATLTVVNTAHELGHVFGLPHAQGWSCAHRECDIVNLGDPYDTMGSGTAVTVTWHDSAEAGSGIARYAVSLDDHTPVSIQQQSEYGLLNTLRLGHLMRGAHKVTIVGIDRAGNRSRPATRRFVVTGRE